MDRFMAGDLEVRCEVIYRRVKNPRIELRFDSLRLILPADFTGDPIEVLSSRSDWIQRKIHEFHEMLERASELELEYRRDKELRSLVSGFLDHYSDVLGVEYGRVRFRRMRSRWGSCSSRGNLSFNTLLSHLPDRMVEYVVLHELAHLREMNHSPRFWGILESEIPDYSERRRMLRYYWARLYMEGLVD
ncbi:M48 family metallopeptidase [Methanothermobacter thermautotrophicus]